MPYLFIFAGGVVAGLWGSGKADDIATSIKWAAISGAAAAALYIAAKATKVI